VLVQESGQHGGEASGPVVRDIIKAYYDKKNKKLDGTTVTATDTKPDEPGKAPSRSAAIQPIPKQRPHEVLETIPASARNDAADEQQPQPQQRRQR